MPSDYSFNSSVSEQESDSVGVGVSKLSFAILGGLASIEPMKLSESILWCPNVSDKGLLVIRSRF